MLGTPELDTVLEVGLIYQHRQVLLGRPVLYPFLPQPVLILGDTQTQVQKFVFGFAELHEVHMGPFFESIKCCIPSLKQINCTTQVAVISKLAEDALDLTPYVITENIKSSN